ncbi:MAG: hypothetical protein OER95_07920 [Acidimicrobiia bacterium]|nr:hypothetical protein [Acidimicrobiia bacterium]
MRRTSFVALVLGLVVLFATPAAARDISNGSQTMVQMWGEGGSYDEVTGTSVYVSIYATDYGDSVEIGYYRFSSTPTTCDDGTPGWLNEELWAYGPGTLETDRTYTSGTAAGKLTGGMGSWTDCGYGEDVVPQNGGPGGDLTVDVVAQFTSTSPLIRQRNANSFKIPGETNSHSSESSTYRDGEIHLTVDQDEPFHIDFGQLGKATWRYHFNSNNP